MKLSNKARQSLSTVRQLRQAKKYLGVDAIYLFVSDVDSDWLKRWVDVG